MNESLNNHAFCKALAKLKEFADMPILNDRDRAGIIQAFEFTFEQCWKMFQRIAQSHGLSAASPRQAIQVAMQLGMIAEEDEKFWLDMLHDRNMTSHIYHEETALQIVERVTRIYLPLFCRLQGR